MRALRTINLKTEFFPSKLLQKKFVWRITLSFVLLLVSLGYASAYLEVESEKIELDYSGVGIMLGIAHEFGFAGTMIGIAGLVNHFQRKKISCRKSGV